MNIDRFNENIVREYLNNYFLSNDRKNLLAKKIVNDYICKRKSRAAYTLMYKKNVYQANLIIIDKFLEFLREKDRQLIQLRYKNKHTFTYIAIKLKESQDIIYLRHKKILTILYFLMNAEVSFKEVYMLSPKILSIIEDRIACEYMYALLGNDLNEKINLNLDKNYVYILDKKKKAISRLKHIVIYHMDSLERDRKELEHKVITLALNDISITRDEIGKKVFLSSSRVVQILSCFKRNVKELYEQK